VKELRDIKRINQITIVGESKSTGRQRKPRFLVSGQSILPFMEIKNTHGKKGKETEGQNGMF